MRCDLKFFFKWVAFFAFVVIVIPLILQRFVFVKRANSPIPEQGQLIKVFLRGENKVVTMKSEEYVLGALMAEMPAEFESEALKAQAVAIRTYLSNKLNAKNKNNGHEDAPICDDSTHCQAYCSYEEMKNKWGKNASFYYEKCKIAVESTVGETAKYNGEPINAVFHAYSNGKTENAEDVWGSKVDYLVSVESPGDLELPKLFSYFEIDVDEFKKKMSDAYGCNFDKKLIGDIVFTKGGSVSSIEIGNKVIKGTDLRKKFDLKSACFSIKQIDDKIKFDVKGYGHGVGMSQYGANYFAKQGLNYKEILEKYYTGISVSK